MLLYASDGKGDSGDSNTFAITGAPAALTLTVPTDATKGGPAETGTVAVPAALDFDLCVSLSSSFPADGDGALRRHHSGGPDHCLVSDYDHR